jgi:hypothetical protein
VNLTGGWHWHWRAWRSQKRWAPAADQIAAWLLAQAMPRQQLVLIGASAGWMLPTAWLTQFEEVHAWDIDPLAAPLFRWRHGRALQQGVTRLHLHTGDGLAALTDCMHTMPNAFFWFDNVLGQLRFTGQDVNNVERQLGQVKRQMRTVAWGSVHDRMSGRCSPSGGALPSPQLGHAPTAMDSPQAQAWLHKMGAISPCLDHLTEQVLPKGTPVQHTAWEFKPGYAHWLEMGWCPPTHDLP